MTKMQTSTADATKKSVNAIGYYTSRYKRQLQMTSKFFQENKSWIKDLQKHSNYITDISILEQRSIKTHYIWNKENQS